MPGTYTQLIFHIVFSTKGREPTISDALQQPLYEYFGGIIRRQGGSLIAIGGMPDHVHILIRLKPTMAPADVVRLIKSNSSKWLNEGRVEVPFRWQSGYGAFTVGRSMVPTVRRYILEQARHHRERGFEQEFVALLERHGVEFDPGMLWE